ncbi:GAF domain-containing protein [Aliiroseovarius sediminis]|uniref:GAF domain-containing protein n=1 Tax=Aliiroseovarius sediminis TaxID=2925839 RepID=UPI001F5AA3B2|nr:GAF domain-containing protein [Aliiroseovarius sediminis]MCI2394808.1 GAF domain-containing protein [Aliiroseovarius sediminis]
MTTSHHATFTAELSAATTADAAQAALHKLANALIDARLFTVMTVDMDTELASRSYTSDPENYPTSGTKPIERNPWFDQVHDDHRMFVANTLDDIDAVFPDAELIGSLGCGAVINLPVVHKGELIATVNMLDAAGTYTPERQKIAADGLTLPALATLLTVAQLNDD